MSAWVQDVAHWGNIRIDYRYQRSNRKTLAISVHPDLTVSVRAPTGIDPERIRKRVAAKGAWIEKSRRDFELYLPKQPPKQFVAGETHRYLGRQYRLKFVQGDTAPVRCQRGYLWMNTSDGADPGKVEQLLYGWYRQRAAEVFQERWEASKEKTARVNIKTPAMTIRRMISRWGSCSTKGRITLNLELIKVPKDCIDYVIFHELCHLKERHHGPRYWSLLRRLVPEYEELRERLNHLANQ